jgi:omega-amidase
VRISSIQMKTKLADVDHNFSRVQKLIRKTVENEKPDVIVLPEMWNIGFFPKENLDVLCDNEGERTKRELGSLARELNINIVAGSVGNRRENQIFNTSLVFNRAGICIAEYDKAHLFSSIGENDYFSQGNHSTIFKLDDVTCGVVIGYDVYFPELTRTLALQGADVLFAVAQWPMTDITHINVLVEARAIENQSFFVFTNSCGTAAKVKYGGNSSLTGPRGEILGRTGLVENTLTTDIDLAMISDINNSTNMFCDRQPMIYRVN